MRHVAYRRQRLLPVPLATEVPVGGGEHGVVLTKDQRIVGGSGEPVEQVGRYVMPSR
jgi:hypothetical protein